MPISAPAPSWTSIKNKPSTVAGFGITDLQFAIDSLPGFNSSIGVSSGYQKFPNGMVLQWGSRTTSTTGTQTFPIAFTSCTSVQFTCAVTGSEFVSAITATNFTYTCPSGPSYWIAIGYI